MYRSGLTHKGVLIFCVAGTLYAGSSLGESKISAGFQSRGSTTESGDEPLTSKSLEYITIRTDQPNPDHLQLIDSFSSLMQQRGTYVKRGRGCIPGVAIKIYKENDRFWALIKDRVFTRRPSNPTVPAPYCFYEMENRFPEFIEIFPNRDLIDPFCQEFRGYRNRRQIIRIRNRTFDPPQCFIESKDIANVEIGGYTYHGEAMLIPSSEPYPPEDASDQTISVSGWDYYQSSWPNQGIEYLGDFNSRTIAAVIDLDFFNARLPFNRYLDAYYGKVKPSVRGNVRDSPVLIGDPPEVEAVPYLYIVHMKLPHRDYVEGF